MEESRGEGESGLPAIGDGAKTMASVLDGISVLDLSWGAAGPIASMLLCDNGAAVTRIEHDNGTSASVL